MRQAGLNLTLKTRFVTIKWLWGYSSIGRARRSQCRGWGFESPYLHQTPTKNYDQVNRVAALVSFLRYRGGKSELHRARCWVIPRGGDPRKVPQKLHRLDISG
jgi:hypothetical protein